MQQEKENKSIEIELEKNLKLVWTTPTNMSLQEAKDIFRVLNQIERVFPQILNLNKSNSGNYIMYPIEVKQKAIEMYENSIPMAEIARKLNITNYHSIYKWLEKGNKEKRAYSTKFAGQKEKVKELLMQGKTLREIIMQTGVKYQTVWSWARKFKQQGLDVKTNDTTTNQ